MIVEHAGSWAELPFYPRLLPKLDGLSSVAGMTKKGSLLGRPVWGPLACAIPLNQTAVLSHTVPLVTDRAS